MSRPIAPTQNFGPLPQTMHLMNRPLSSFRGWTVALRTSGIRTCHVVVSEKRPECHRSNGV